jgi:hypothetical protein
MKILRVSVALVLAASLPLPAFAQAKPTAASVAAPMLPVPAVQRAPATPRFVPAPSEQAKIQSLIASVENLPGAVFIRNGTEYDGHKAADHLRLKLKYAGKRVQTADQFITNLATGSSMSGKPYTIRFADGRTVESAAYFRAELKRIEAGRRDVSQRAAKG